MLRSDVFNASLDCAREDGASERKSLVGRRIREKFLTGRAGTKGEEHWYDGLVVRRTS